MSAPLRLEKENEPVAIVGMGCRWAGGVKDARRLWQLLKNKQDGWREFAEPGFPTNGFYHPNQDRPGSIGTRGGFPIDEDARLFDPGFFGIMGREVETMDPSQRKLLEVVYEAFENAGETWDSIAGTRTGVYIGNFSLDHLLIQARDWEYATNKSYAATGADTCILANRISYVFNLHGPSLVTNTACSSSMYALHLAVSAIRNGDCDGAVVAAANWISDPGMQFVLDKLGALSGTSRCHTFDASADGYARGEGFVALYLKKSSIAVLDKLPIRAMIRGTAVNSNGKTGGITRPSLKGQEDAIRKAYENAGNLRYSDTTFFECHGTGTQVGDPLEVSAVGNVFASSRSDAAEDRLLIGSIKPNLGHTEGASGLASVMKVVLALEAGEIPPTHGIEKLNPNIDFERAKVLVVKDSTVPWPEGKLRRGSINSFGFGGANGHCIIDHVNNVLPGYEKPGIIGWLPAKYQSTNDGLNGFGNGHLKNETLTDNEDFRVNGVSTPTPPATPPHHSPITSATKKNASAKANTRQFVLLPFSAHNSSSLKLNITALSQVIDQWRLADIAYTLSCKRSQLQQRSFRIVDKDDLALGLIAEKPILTSPLEASNVAYVFTGQGAQWHAMGAQLFDYGMFRSTIAYLDYVLQGLPECPPWTITATLSGAFEPEHTQAPKVSQVASMAVQVGLVDLLASWSVRPVAVVGHSSGEVAAAYASGHITAAEAITTAYYRGLAASKNKRNGGMLAVGLGPDQVSDYLHGKEEHIRIGCMNSPSSVTLSGDVDAIEALAAVLNKDNVFNRVLRTSGSAYHSHHMTAVGGDYIEMLYTCAEHIQKLGLGDETQRYPRIPWVSSVKPGKIIADGEVTPRYWREHLQSPVRFTQALTNLMSLENGTKIDVLCEIGPSSALKGPIGQILKDIGKNAQYVSALQRNEDGRKTMLQLAGTLFATNSEIDLAAVNSVDDGAFEGKHILTHGCTAIDLPPYQYDYGPVIYNESRVSKDYRLRKTVRHDLLGSQVPGTGKFQLQWRNILRTKDIPWLSQHRLLSDAIFPAAGFIALGVEAATRAHHDLSGDREIAGYRFRDIYIDTALRIPEDDNGIEIITSMEIGDTATASIRDWARFAITSVAKDSNEWTQHCTGLIKVEVSLQVEKPKLEVKMDPIFPSLQTWYDKFAEIGVGYGEMFRSLADLRVDPHQNLATASIALNTTAGAIKGGESNYQLHPTALTAALQVALIGFCGGEVEKANAALVPIHLSQLYLKAGDRQGWSRAITRGSIQGFRSAYAQLQMVDTSGDVFLEADSMRFTTFKELKMTSDMDSKRPFSSPFTRLVWKPDIRALNNRQIRELYPPPRESVGEAAALEIADLICCLVVFEVYRMFVLDGQKCSPKGEIKRWFAWIKRIVEEDQRPNMVEVRMLTQDQRQQLLQKLYDEANDRAEAKAAKLLLENAGEILNERRTGIDVLVSSNLLMPLYEVGPAVAGSHPQVSSILDCLGHENPNLRILEIGAGTGAATRAAMKALAGPNGIKRYYDYTFTDVSAGFLVSAKEMLSEYRDVNYSILDIEQNPLENGFEPVYDVILACEAIHATASMEKTLAHCRSLLKPGGKLVVAETTRMRVLFGVLYGTLTGYWRSDGRTEGPFMNLETWQTRLRDNGFSGTDLVLDDYHAPHSTTSVLVSTRVEPQDIEKPFQPTDQKTGVIYLLYDAHIPQPLLGQIAAEYEGHGVICKALPSDNAVDAVPVNARIIALLSSKNDLFDADEHRLKSFRHLAQNSHSMVWLTTGSIISGQNPKAALMTGLLRVIAAKNPAGQFLSINIQKEIYERGNHDLVRGIVEKEFALQAKDTGESSIDNDFVWQDGCLRVSRVVPDPGLGEYSETIRTPARQGFQMLPVDSQGPIRAVFETVGNFNSLYFRRYTELLPPLPDDYIDIKVAATGLNLDDVTLATGRNSAARKNLSSEYAGVVEGVGKKVAGLSVGDRVYGIGRGHFGNYERVPAVFAQKLRSSDDLIEAATIPTVYTSAVYAFEFVARLRKGHKVLIQSATSGLGLAAIQLARSREAEIFATISTTDQVSLLVDAAGVPIDHILLSQETESLARTAKSMDKGGFDIILSTVVGGDSLLQSLQVLAPRGHYINVGRVDRLESKELGLELFRKNASLSSYELDEVLENDPELGGELMRIVHGLYQTGVITPIRPVSSYDVSQLDQAFLSFSSGSTIGKRVITFQNPNSVVKMLRQPQTATFDPKARYIVTGNLSGFDRNLIRWMVDRGAHDFVVLLSQGLGTSTAQALLDDLKSRGVRIESKACDISKREQIVQAIDQISSSGCPIKGIVNTASSPSDSLFDKLTIDQWRKGIAAEAQGLLNLHEATLTLPLDFFVMLTGVETIWAPRTKAARFAADNYADYFARYRRQLGLPASAVSLGLVSKIDSNNRETCNSEEEMYACNAALAMTEHQALAKLEPAFLASQELSGYLGQQQDPLSAASFSTCLNPVDLANVTSTDDEPRWHCDGRVSLIIRAMKDAKRHKLTNAEYDNDGNTADSLSSTAQLRHAFDNAIKTGPDARTVTVDLVTNGTVKALAEMLYIDAESINPSKSVAEHGVDSLIAAELRSWFHQALDANMHNVLDDQTSIKMLAGQIVDKALSGEARK